MPDEQTTGDSTETEADAALEAKIAEMTGKPDPSEEADDAGETDGHEEPDGTDGKSDPEGPEQPELTDRQRATAKQMGISEERLAALGEDAGEFLDELGSRWSKEMSKLGRRLQAKADTGKEEAGKNQTASSDLPELADFTEDDDEFEGQLKKLNLVISHVRGMHERLTAIEADFAVREERATEEECDRFFGGLLTEEGKPKDYPQYGTGSLADLSDDSPEAAARLELMEEAGFIRQGFEANGRPISMGESLERALSFLGRDNLKTAERRKARDAARKARERQTTRTTAREPAPKGTEAERDEALEQFAREHGIPLTD